MFRNNKHTNSHIQSDWNEHGEASFVFSILDDSDTEQKWFEHFKPHVYNKWLHTKSPKGLPKPKHVISALRAGNAKMWADNAHEMRRKCRKLTDSQVRTIRGDIYLTKRSYSDIGAEYGVSAATICFIANGKRYADVSP